MEEIVNVLIIEDDFRVANINKEFVEKVDGFQVVQIAKTAEEAKDYLENVDTLPDLVLLDVYIPDTEGLDLFWSIRKTFHHVDIVMVTAAKEVITIEEALRGGVFDYIVKPVNIERMKQTLKRYQQHRYILSAKSELSQTEIDHLTGRVEVSNLTSKSSNTLPKGIDALTLEKIKGILKVKGEGGVTAIELGREIGASRSTARRYLEYLVAINVVTAELKYGEVGRPERRYLLF